MKTKSWYYRPTAGHETHWQGGIIEEETGRDVAIAYDGDTDGALLAASPDMLQALVDAESLLMDIREVARPDELHSDFRKILRSVQDAIQKTRGDT